jgi:hypothetical protein
MNFAFRAGSRIRKLFIFLILALSISAPALAAKWFVDNALGDVKPEERVTVNTPQPVQLIFEFQRDGKAVPKAVKQVKPMVLEALKERGIFSEVSDTPTVNGAMLNIVINNVVDKEELSRLKKKAFGAGLSFGLGSGVVATDNYFVHLELVPATGKPSIKTDLQHAIHMKYGKTDAVVPGTQVKNILEAVKGMIKQSTAKGLNTIIADPGFAAMSPVTLPTK